MGAGFALKMTPYLRVLSIALFLGLVALPGCRPKPTPAGAGGAGGFSVQVVAVPVKRQPVVENINLIGSITANEFVEIKSETDGIVREFGFAEGQRVEKGTLLIALDDTKFEASLNQAEANLKLAKANYQRAQQMLGEKLIPQQAYDQAAATLATEEASVALMRRNMKDARVLAPFSGVTGARQVSPGQVISRSSPLTTLVDLDIVKVELNVPERYLSQIATGQKLTFSVAAFPRETFDGDVYFISPQLDPGTRTALVKARVPNPNSRLRGGMFASLELHLELRPSALVIPEPALINNGDAIFVFVIGPDGRAVMRPIQVGLRLAGKVEVLKGLTVGEQVIVEGVQKLGPGVPVKLGPPETAAPYTNN
jgi:membrane fusion protein, multidrug efflux system